MIITENSIRFETKSFIGQIIVIAEKKTGEIVFRFITCFGTKEKVVAVVEVKEFFDKIYNWLNK